MIRPRPVPSIALALASAVAATAWPGLALGTGGKARSTEALGGLTAKGYLSARYAYVGSASPATVSSSLRLTGSFQILSASERIGLKYRSHHWVAFKHPAEHLYESAFEDRSIVQTVSLETKDLIAAGLGTRIGRVLPEIDYASAPAVDGGVLTFGTGPVTFSGAAGRPVDSWNGEQAARKLLAAGQVKLQTERVRLAAGFQSASYGGRRQKETPAGLNVRLGKDLRAEAYGAYDFEFKTIARAGLNLSWQAGNGGINLAVTRWKNPADQTYLLDKGRDLPSWGLHSEPVPSTYRDVRLTASYRQGGWGLRGTLGLMGGVRSGWTASSHVTAPAFLGLVAGFGAQAVRSDFIDSYAIDGHVSRQAGRVALELTAEVRRYGWCGDPSPLHTTDGSTEVSAEYLLTKHFRVSAAAGGNFRKLGDETFKPRMEIRLVART